MDKEKLFEVFSLAEYLGFDPKTEINSKVFNHVCNGLDTYYIPDLEYYLVLCEIQKWLRDVHLLDIRVSNYFNEAGDNILIYQQEVYFNPGRFEETSDDDTEYKTYEQALSVSILECLNLLKNENN